MKLFSTPITLLAVMISSSMLLSACDTYGDTRASGQTQTTEPNSKPTVESSKPTVDNSKPNDKPTDTTPPKTGSDSSGKKNKPSQLVGYWKSECISLESDKNFSEIQYWRVTKKSDNFVIEIKEKDFANKTCQGKPKHINVEGPDDFVNIPKNRVDEFVKFINDDSFNAIDKKNNDTDKFNRITQSEFDAVKEKITQEGNKPQVTEPVEATNSQCKLLEADKMFIGAKNSACTATYPNGQTQKLDCTGTDNVLVKGISNVEYGYRFTCKSEDEYEQYKKEQVKLKTTDLIGYWSTGCIPYSGALSDGSSAQSRNVYQHINKIGDKMIIKTKSQAFSEPNCSGKYGTTAEKTVEQDVDTWTSYKNIEVQAYFDKITWTMGDIMFRSITAEKYNSINPRSYKFLGFTINRQSILPIQSIKLQCLYKILW